MKLDAASPEPSQAFRSLEIAKGLSRGGQEISPGGPELLARGMWTLEANTAQPKPACGAGWPLRHVTPADASSSALRVLNCCRLKESVKLSSDPVVVVLLVDSTSDHRVQLPARGPRSRIRHRAKLCLRLSNPPISPASSLARRRGVIKICRIPASGGINRLGVRAAFSDASTEVLHVKPVCSMSH